MTFVSPFWLLGLLPVAAAAVLAFVRPAWRERIVGSLALWQKAARLLGGGEERSARRMPTGWALLLLGATLAVLAAARPVWRREAIRPKESPAPRETPAAPITFDALAGEIQPDGQAEIFARLRNHTAQTFTGSLTITPKDASTPVKTVSLTIPPTETRQAILAVPDAPTLTVRVKHPGDTVVASANVHKIQPGLTRVATAGNVGPLLQRYIQADARLALVTDVARADVVLAQGVNPPKDAAALVLAPPTPPPGRRAGEQAFVVTFEQADVAADDPVMKDVNVAAMAVRRLQPWRPGDRTAGKVLLRMNDQAVIVRSRPENDPSNRTPRRVYVAFAITRDNTNIETVPGPFVTLLADAIRWLHPAGGPRGRYVRDDVNRGAFHRRSDEIGTILVGARGETQIAPTNSKTRLKVPLELYPWLIAAAMLCWTLGWWRSGRKAA